MSKTLFWYVFRDLLRIFLMASAALAGIMSFGGLLRPLTEHGLDASQVSKMLTYFMPAMTTYSFPVAALFAATMVYGRLSADNELTACRAGGISFLSMTTPALVLGLIVSLISLLFLSFIVPIFTLKVEQVVYSNLAQLVQNQIERSHQIKLDKFNVFAQSARVLEADPARPGDQRVELIAPMIASYTILNAADPDLSHRLPVASEFFMAKSATAYIHQQRDDVELTVVLEKGTRFFRNTAGSKPASEMTIGHTIFGPRKMPSPIKEDAKFMTIDRLKEMYENPEISRRLQDQLNTLIQSEQARLYLERIQKVLRESGRFSIDLGDEIATLVRGDLEADLRNNGGELVLQSKPRPEARQVKLIFTDKSGDVLQTEEAMDMRVRVSPHWDLSDPQAEQTLDVNVEGFDVVIQTEEEEARHKKFGPRPIVGIPMPPELALLRKNTADYYLNSKTLSRSQAEDLEGARNKLMGKLQSEIHSRASFAISCLVLVLIGCALGMMFRSSNFLSAFAVSFIPAMFSITLIVTGQQVCSHAHNSVALGLAFIWGGNAGVLLLAVGLLWKLNRT